MNQPTPKFRPPCVALPTLDPAFKANPHTLYDALREAGGVHRMRLPSGFEAWIVTRYASARALLADARLTKISPETAATSPPMAPHPLFTHLLTTDPPLHTQLRALLASHFSADRLRGLEPRIQAAADALLDSTSSRDVFDVVTEFAVPLAFGVVCDLVGIPAEYRTTIRGAMSDLEAADFDAPERVPAIAEGLQETLSELAGRPEILDSENALRTVAAASRRGEISLAQACALAFLLLAAGHETTANLIASGTFRLLSERSIWKRLCDEPQLAEPMVEELLRLESPLEMATARYAAEDITVDGVTIPKGEAVFIGIAAGNRDPSQFSTPDQFDWTRPAPKNHLAFGHGIHRCLGAALARVEGRIALTAISQRYPTLELSEPPSAYRWKPGLITRGLESLSVRCPG